MPAEHPSVADYLANLPAGVDSYPECSVKASILRSMMASRPLGADVPLAPTVRKLIDDPPPVSSWIPEVYFNIAVLWIRATHFDANDALFLPWLYDHGRRILATPLYRVLFLVVSPERLLIGMERRWGLFRRGTQITSVRHGPKDLELHLHSPPHLYGPANVLGLTATLRAAMDSAGANGSRVGGEIASPTLTVYRTRWD